MPNSDESASHQFDEKRSRRVEVMRRASARQFQGFGAFLRLASADFGPLATTCGCGSTTSAISYTMDVPRTEDTSAGFRPQVASSQRTKFVVAARKASSWLPAIPLAMRYSVFSILGFAGA